MSLQKSCFFLGALKKERKEKENKLKKEKGNKEAQINNYATQRQLLLHEQQGKLNLGSLINLRNLLSRIMSQQPLA